MLDEASLLFASRRAGRPSWYPEPGRRYFDKIAMRRNFDPQDEYLCLEGTSFFSHGHFDGNTVTRLTWKDRIWLFDLHYINFTPRYHSGVTVTFEGRQDDPPLLTSLDLEADLPATGMLQTTSERFQPGRLDAAHHLAEGPVFPVRRHGQGSRDGRLQDRRPLADARRHRAPGQRP